MTGEQIQAGSSVGSCIGSSDGSCVGSWEVPVKILVLLWNQVPLAVESQLSAGTGSEPALELVLWDRETLMRVCVAAFVNR